MASPHDYVTVKGEWEMGNLAFLDSFFGKSKHFW